VVTSLQRPPDVVEGRFFDRPTHSDGDILGISSGRIDERFVNIWPGPLNHARWLTVQQLKDPDPLHKNACAQQRPQVSGAFYPSWVKIKHELCIGQSFSL
jgi:hypothetical protein